MKLSEIHYQAPVGLKEQTLLDTGLADGYVVLASPIGAVNVAFNTLGVSAVAPTTEPFVDDFRARFRRPLLAVDRLPTLIESGVQMTFETGRLDHITIDWRGQTDFQQAVLKAAASIPPGEVRPYGWIAHQVGRPNAVRAVGSALGQNPVPILVACHRVVRSDGHLGKYRFGTSMKAALLESEGLQPAPVQGTLVGSPATKVVCYPSCEVARGIDPDQRRWFRSAGAAALARYRPCNRCQPVLS
ncbi:MAG: methylated-DNA--[protein]-cysteine S-methyltransferase [Acidimicrobiia bacterium]|nr:methylated-DNA--[protein]-cysteine S-methyltransferase [Acidimicrobiia bacterium]MDH5502616.1 methylated-DNA--[protein]-cysteine S-methyltransferase [Acidimicrobiia bacterium]